VEHEESPRFARYYAITADRGTMSNARMKQILKIVTDPFVQVLGRRELEAFFLSKNATNEMDRLMYRFILRTTLY